MNILGINYHGHDASAALLSDGQLVAAIEEERFRRFQKHFGGFPVRSIEFCLKQAGIGPEKLDRIGYYIDPEELLSSYALQYAFSPWWSVRKKFLLASRALYYYHSMTLRRRIRHYFPSLNPACKIHFVRHHDAHLASAFFASPFETADILSLDGIGEWETTVLAQGHGSTITRKQAIYFPHSIGYLFSAVTRHLGFRVNNDEYKVMGLAGYGDPSRYQGLLRRIVLLKDDGGYDIDAKFLDLSISWGHVSRKFIQDSGLAPRRYGDELRQEHKDMAAAIQQITEEAGIHLARHMQRKTGGRNICLSGGVALNCIMNARILAETPYQDIFVQPAAYDASGSLGSALWIQHEVLQKPRSFEMKHAYYGYEAKEDEIYNALQKFEGIKFKKSADIAKDTAAEISKQRIVGWYQGRMEWGPRALGNRSILADPRDRKMMDYVNDKVKHREDFRPFAPSCKLEAYQKYFEINVPSPFMLLICKVKESMRSKIAAVTHTDGTARYQTVDPKTNPLFWNLLNEFEKISGHPVLLNTSFNVNGETIVMTPEDAISCFLRTGIDVLALGNYLVEKA